MPKLLNGKLATDDFLTRFGVHGPSKCYCCYNAKEGDVNHLFSQDEVVGIVWKYFQDTCGLSMPNSDNIRTKLMRWWLFKSPNKVHELIM